MNITTFLNHLDRVKKTGADKWQACCPAHDDRSPSMAIKDTGDKILVHCFGGCTTDEIVGSLGLKVDDLFSNTIISIRRDKSLPTNRELLDQLELEMFVMLSAIGHYKKRIPIHEQDKDRAKQAASRIQKILKALYE